MATDRREPIWNVISMALQVVGIIVAFGVGSATEKVESLQALVYMVPTYALFCLVGTVAAGVAFMRRERWYALSLIAFLLNVIPGMLLLSVILRKVRF